MRVLIDQRGNQVPVDVGRERCSSCGGPTVWADVPDGRRLICPNRQCIAYGRSAPPGYIETKPTPPRRDH